MPADPETWRHTHEKKLLAVVGVAVTLVFAVLVAWRLNVEEQQGFGQQQQGQQQAGADSSGSRGDEEAAAGNEAEALLPQNGRVQDLRSAA